MTEDRWPLLQRFPGLADLPRLELRTAITPVEPLGVIAPGLWIKRDDLAADPIGGNKVRALEFLLGRVSPDRAVATVGATGSTHVLTTVMHAASRAAMVRVATWPQASNPVADAVHQRFASGASVRRMPHALPALAWLRWRATRGDLTVPAGGTSALGILGHINGALELAAQIERGELPVPKRIVLPLGSGGTVAGLTIGLALAGVQTTIVAVRVVPKIVGRPGRIRRLVRETLELLRRRGEDARISVLPPIQIVENCYGGAYGRPLPRADDAARTLRDATGLPLDATYTAKAFTAALDVARDGPVLFWLTFDARWMNR